VGAREVPRGERADDRQLPRQRESGRNFGERAGVSGSRNCVPPPTVPTIKFGSVTAA
jgi:hypothetical protein